MSVINFNADIEIIDICTIILSCRFVEILLVTCDERSKIQVRIAPKEITIQ